MRNNVNYIYQQNGLTLKVLDERSSEDIYKFYLDNREYFDPYESDKPDNFYTPDFVKALVRAEYNSFAHHNHMRFYLFCDEEPDKIIGTVSFSNINKSLRSCTIGYKIDHSFTNCGYGMMMTSMAVNAVVTDYNMHRIEAYIHPDNEYSLKLCRSLGFVSEGTAHSYAMIDGSWQDHLRYVYIA